ncbi:MAG TPA: primosomal protein N' [Polyangia bacterium]|nr:primosomal protein N' [Polyangia bacterium]
MPGDASLLEVAVALPVWGTFTYRDPRPAARVPVGTQVVVPFGSRTVTGFVVGRAAAGASAAKARDIEEIVAGEPPFDEEMIGFCRWVGDYYQAPLGEVLRASLPQGERAVAVRSVRLTEEGRRALDGRRAGQQAWLVPSGTGDSDPILNALVAAGGTLPIRAIMRLPGRASARLSALATDGLVEVGDSVVDRRPPPTVTFAVAVDERRGDLPARAAGQRALFVKLGGQPAGVDVRTLTVAEKTLLRALVKRGVARLEHRPVAINAVDSDVLGTDEGGASASGAATASRRALTANAAQAAAIAALVGALGKGFATFVLHGITGSGKTEVYLQVIAEARAAGRGALVLVPEIALTPQLAARFRARFGEDVAVLHSALPARERLAAWRRLREGKVGIALGARSAIFAPVQRLGVIVVDEEHDGSFKQEDGVRYNGRDLAVVRAQRAGAVAVLGSATPSLESYQNTLQGRFRLLTLPERATPRPLPSVEIIDLRRHPVGPDGLLSAALAEAVAANLAAREQTILFLNRRGFSTVVLCRACGSVVQCPHCAVSLTYHQKRARLVCHYCGNTELMPLRCPSCASPKLERLGTGTERVEALIRQRFPDARVARLDRDTADAADATGEQTRGLGPILAGMQSGAIDILIGTQMVTKGHDFAGVTLVGVLQPDQGMHLPDFRAAERTFQLLEQVAGRAGRGDRPGRVIVQTYAPEHPAIVNVRTHDYAAFVGQELEFRRQAEYPPFARMVVLRLDAREEAQLRVDAAAVAESVRAAVGSAVRVLGPAEAPIGRVRGRARYQIWLSSKDRAALAAAARAATAVKRAADVRLAVDVDPQSVL